MKDRSADGIKTRSWNWWKIAFFVTLVAFELARETAVLASANKPTLIAGADVYSHNGWTVAEGIWKRMDGGEKLVPSIVRIECDEARGECVEVAVNVYDNSVFAPHINTYKATFEPEAVIYENTNPICVRYVTRIDLRLKKALAVRERTKNTTAECAGMEGRMEMQMGNGWELTNPLEGHFVPIMSGLRAVFAAFE